MLIIIVRTLFLYALVVTAIRIMGKRQVGQLQPLDLVVIIMISELAAIPSEDIGIPLISGVVPILVLLLVSVLLSTLELKSEKARKIINGTPSILIERGRIMEEELRKNRFNLSDLLEELRVKNAPNVADVEFAIMETSGQISVLLKSFKRPATPGDMNLTPLYEDLPAVLITDGSVNYTELQRINKSEEWLKSELKKRDLHSYKDVFFASFDSSGKLFVQETDKSSRKREQKI